ncbi:unnamed protein product [Ixodes hexagonus]
MPAIRYFQCHRCKWRTTTLKTLFRHFHSAHGHEQNWVCGLQGCMKTHVLYSAYRKHVSRNHADLLNENTATSEPFSYSPGSIVVAPDLDSAVPPSLVEPRIQDTPSDEVPRLQKQFSLLLLKWKETRRLPEATIQEITSDVIMYMQALSDHFLAPVLPTEDASTLTSLLQDELPKLGTKCGRENYWRHFLPFVEPRRIVLGRTQQGKLELFHYIPVCDVLKNFLEIPDFHGSEAVSGYLVDVFDGTAFKDHAFFQGDRAKICIQLYSDEFEVCDPLASKRGKHKMIAVYYSILNAPAASKSRLSQIHVALLVNEKLALKYGLSRVFEPLIQDILHLESTGIVVHGEVLKGSVLFMAGDNLSCHRIGGFKANFSHGRICRYCLALRHEIPTKHAESDFVRRTPEGHMHHLRMKANGAHTLSLYGVKEACHLTFTGFLPTEHLPPDVMHDIHEGVLPFVLKHLLASLIASGMFSLSDLNAAVSEFSYAACDRKNRPEVISMDYIRGKANIKGNASQIFCFLGIWPYMWENVFHLSTRSGSCIFHCEKLLTLS